MMADIKRLKKDLQRLESFRGQPYDCKTGLRLIAPVGHATIGYGRNLDANPLTEAEAEHLLNNDIQKAWAEAVALVPDLFLLNDVRQEVVINMVFQLGSKGFSKFKKFRAALKRNDFKRAAAEMRDSDWYDQVESRAEELRLRMLKGKIDGSD